MKDICLDTIFYEKCFDTQKGIAEIFRDNLSISVQKNILLNNDFYNSGVILTREQEQKFFKRYNYIKYRIKKIKSWNSDESKKRSEIKKRIQKLYQIREILIKCNTRLMVKPVLKFSKGHEFDSVHCNELISNSYCHMIKIIDRFDYRKGFKFSTYFSHAIFKNLIRDTGSERNKKDRYYRELSNGEELISCDDGSNFIYDQVFVKKLFCFLESSSFEKMKISDFLILKKYYGVCGENKHTLKDLSKELGVSKERVRQIKLKAEIFIKNNIGKFEIKYDPVF